MILFVGDQPSKRTDPDVPFRGAACEARLKNWIKQIIPNDETYQIINTTSGLAIWCLWAVDDGYPIIALGNNASKYLKTLPHFKLPHPSGRNRQINDETFINEKLLQAKEYILSFHGVSPIIK